MTTHDITVIGAGLAGAEAAWQLAQAGLSVQLFEQKPHHRTEAQVSDWFAELVCSNSFRSANPQNAVGLLKEELARGGSLLMREAMLHRVPAGDALAVDRVAFGEAMTRAMREHPRIDVVAKRVDALPPPQAGPVIVATGPLTAASLAESLQAATAQEGLYFYDAIAPIVSGASVDTTVAFAASRWDKGDSSDYLNCPLDRAQYETLIDFLLSADVYEAHAFEKAKYFAGCQPIEVLAAYGRDALRYGPLKPVGLTDPRTGRWPHAVIQLRAEDRARQSFNLVGLQTKLKHGAQKQLMRLIPGLEQAEILRFGALHRNTFLDAPALLDDNMCLRTQPHIMFAGQITGVEGYVESAASGYLAAHITLRRRQGLAIDVPPPTTAMGALYTHCRGHARIAGRSHEPQNVNWGLFAASGLASVKKRDKQAVKAQRTEVAREAFGAWLAAARPELAGCGAPVGAVRASALAAAQAAQSQEAPATTEAAELTGTAEVTATPEGAKTAATADKSGNKRGGQSDAPGADGSCVFAAALDAFEQYLTCERRVSAATCVAYRCDLQLVFAEAKKRKRSQLAQLDEVFLQDALHSFTERNGRPLSPRSIGRKQSALRIFFGWCSTLYDPTLKDPTPYLISPPQPRGLPRPLEVPAALALMQGKLEADECSSAEGTGEAATKDALTGGLSADGPSWVSTLGRLSPPHTGAVPATEHSKYVEARDVAALLLLYGPGLRRQEVLDLKLADVQLDKRWLAVTTRGANKRMVPIPTGCIEGLRAYLCRRPSTDNPYFLAGRNNRSLSARTLASIVGRAAVLLMGRHATPHQLRHSFATHLLEHGASLQHIQRLLGHNQLASTMRYREVAKEQLASAHKLAHPRARSQPASDA